MRSVKLGDRVRVEYCRVRMNDKGQAQKAPAKVLEFTAGGGEVMPGLSAGVVGMAAGERKRLTLQPADAFGDIRPALVRDIPRAQIPKRITLRVGKRLSAVSTLSGRKRRVRVVEIGRESVKVDGNHVLAGKVIELDVHMICVDAASEGNGSRP